MTDPLFDRRRIGKFLVDIDTLEHGDFPEMIKALGITIIRAESMYLNRAIEYIGICPSFEVVPDGFTPNEYIIIVHHDENGDRYEAKKR